MKKLFIFFIIPLFFSACTLKKVVRHHGVHFLDKKQEKLTVNLSNKNDIIDLLGPPSTKGTFDEELWIYMEIQTSSSKISKYLTKYSILDELSKKFTKIEFLDSISNSSQL